MSHRGKRHYPKTKQMREERRKRAEERNAEYNKLTTKEKIDRLPPEPAAQKQRAKLLKRLETEQKK